MVEAEGLIALVGAPFVGSFLSVVITRLPAGRALVLARSACPYCGRVLAARDLVPLLSWTLAGGRCRGCGAALGWFYPGIELAAVAVALSAIAAVPEALVLPSCLLGWTLLALAAIDLRETLLPDALTLPLVPAGWLVAAWAAPGTWPSHVTGAAAGFLAFVAVAAAYHACRGRDGLGLGDAKLLAAAGAWVSWQGLAGVVLVATLSGLATVLLRGIAGEDLTPDQRIAFGPHLCLGTWLVWLFGPLVFG